MRVHDQLNVASVVPGAYTRGQRRRWRSLCQQSAAFTWSRIGLKRIFYSSSFLLVILFSSLLSQSPFTVLFSSFFSFSIVRYNTFKTFSFVSIKLLSQADKRQKSFRKNKKNVETLSESFTSRGKARLQYRVTASARNLKDKNIWIQRCGPSQRLC